MGPFGETGTVKVEKPYTIWAFRRVQGCYECDVSDTTEFNFPVESVKLTQEEFDNFIVGVKHSNKRDIVYLYSDCRQNHEVIQTVHDLVKEGQEAVARIASQRLKLKQKEENRLKDIEKKKLAKEQKLYAELKRKFEETK